jgi:site-specific DNA-methyltransferase (adenine-specific)
MRQVVRASLPLGRGTLLDPFMGSGATIAAAEALRLSSIGLEISREYFVTATKAIPELAKLMPVECGAAVRRNSRARLNSAVY